MRKINNKGFMLMETLIVSVFVGVTLILLFVQLRNIETSYDRTFSYNTTHGLYNAAKTKKYLLTRNYEEMVSDVLSTTNGYIDITSCTSGYYTATGENASLTQKYCTDFYKATRIKKILFSLEDLKDAKYKILTTGRAIGVSQKMIDFAQYVKYDGQNHVYRLIIEYEDETYASIKIGE
ncbi:MAG: hypothetical protein PHN72_03700 [Bacilli bacterium]|nr:hypothetical protein [Bacilli bacterium]